MQTYSKNAREKNYIFSFEINKKAEKTLPWITGWKRKLNERYHPALPIS